MVRKTLAWDNEISITINFAAVAAANLLSAVGPDSL
jgi:hypothetical protein